MQKRFGQVCVHCEGHRTCSETTSRVQILKSTRNIYATNQCTVGNLYLKKIGSLNLGSDEASFTRRRGYLQWKQTTGTRVPVALVCGFVVRSRYQNINEYIIAQNVIKYTSFMLQTLHNPTTSPRPWKMELETMTSLGPWYGSYYNEYFFRITTHR